MGSECLVRERKREEGKRKEKESMKEKGGDREEVEREDGRRM